MPYDGIDGILVLLLENNRKLKSSLMSTFLLESLSKEIQINIIEP